jgi:hypothetical protein
MSIFLRNSLASKPQGFPGSSFLWHMGALMLAKKYLATLLF